MSPVGAIFDAALAAALLGLAWLALSSSNLYRAVFLFVTFGIVLALVWARLGAPDIALAEAAIGAGLMGVLSLAALGLMQESKRGAMVPAKKGKLKKERLRSGLFLAPVSLLAGILVVTVLQLPQDPGGLTSLVGEKVEASGVESPLTAVLLNFRAYDTLLELGVMLLGVLGILAAYAHADLPGVAPQPSSSPVFIGLIRLLVPSMLLIAGYFLWLGKFAAGGAFQAGVIFGASGVLLRLCGIRTIEALPKTVWQTGLLLGFASLFAVGGAAWGFGYSFLEYPLGWAGTIIVIVESIAALSIGVMVTALLIASQPATAGSQNRQGGRP